MKIFVDSANLREIEEALERGFASGITTNPSILSKEERRDFSAHIRDIIALLQKYNAPLSLSVELFTTEPDEMLRRFPILSQTYAMLLLFGTEQQTPALRSQLEHYLQLAENSLLAAGNMPRLGEVLAVMAREAT